MKSNSNKKIADFLYKQSISNEIYPDELDGESLAIQEMLLKIRKLGYEFYYLSDIRFRNIKDPKVMEIILEYYFLMESIYTKGHLLKKIDPVKFPIVIDLALKEYNELSPLGKKDISAFQEVISKGKSSDEYIHMLLSILEDPDNYASSFFIRERLLKTSPELLKKLTIFYSHGILLPATLKEFAVYKDNTSYNTLLKVAQFTDEDIKMLLNNQTYTLCPTMYEYWRSCCSVNTLHIEAKKLIKKNFPT